jgi:hypothetical protein
MWDMDGKVTMTINEQINMIARAEMRMGRGKRAGSTQAMSCRAAMGMGK